MSTEQRLIRTMVQSFAEIIERQVLRFENQGAEYERKLAEHRASFAARTGADEKIIGGLRTEIVRLKLACDAYAADWDTAGKACRMRVDEYPLGAVIRLVRDDAERAEVAKRLIEERDALRAEVAALQERLRSSIARGDFAQMEVAALKSQNPKQHPVKVGEWIVRTAAGAQLTPIGTVAQVVSVADGLPDGYEYVIAGGRWHSDYCEPCDQPATHDTEAGKAAAESAVKTEPVAEEIKVGDVVEVVSHTGHNTWPADVGSVGTVVTVEEINDSISVHLEHVPGKKNALAGYVSFCDVRKVTT